MSVASVPQQIKSLPTFAPSPSFVAEVNGNPVKVELVNITPDMAAEMLTHNTHNRNLKSKHRAYADDMALGAWSFTGAPITFDRHGVLLDGQNRLHGLILAGEDRPDLVVPMLVVRGLEPDAQDDTDTGVMRKLQDILTLHGEENPVTLAAVLRLVHGWNSGARRNLGSGSDFTNPQLLRTLAAHPEVRNYAQHEVRRIADASGLTSSVVGLCWWLFDQIDTEDAAEFFKRLGEDTNHNKGEPIHELRRSLAASESASVRSARNRVWMIAVTIKAWNAYRRGDTVGLYRWRTGGAKPEAFPEPI